MWKLIVFTGKQKSNIGLEMLWDIGLSIAPGCSIVKASLRYNE